MGFSDYIVYVDESGDHGLKSIDSDYPVFVLAFCIFNKETYVREGVPSLQRFKFESFGHDMVVLHEREIRKAQGAFKRLVGREFREKFMSRLSTLLESADFTIIASAIDKQRLKRRYPRAVSPYDLALMFCMERLWLFLRELRQQKLTTHVVFESRGRREDNELELVFRRVAAGANARQQAMPFEPVFVSKKANCCGLQIADLVARPIGLKVLRPKQANRAYEIIETKFRSSLGSRSGSLRGKVEGYGLKIFP